MAKPKPTKEQVKEAAFKVIEYEKKIKQLQEEYSEYRKMFRLRGQNTINSEFSLRYPLNNYFDRETASNLSREIFLEILANNEELAARYINSKTYDHSTGLYTSNEYREMCFNCLLKYPNKLFKKLKEHLDTVNYRLRYPDYSTSGRFDFTQQELDTIWELQGNYYLENFKNTVNDFYTLFSIYGDRFNYDDKMLLAKRIMGRNKDIRAKDLIKSPYIPQDIKDLLDSYLLMQKLK